MIDEKSNPLLVPGVYSLNSIRSYPVSGKCDTIACPSPTTTLPDTDTSSLNVTNLGISNSALNTFNGANRLPDTSRVHREVTKETVNSDGVALVNQGGVTVRGVKDGISGGVFLAGGKDGGVDKQPLTARPGSKGRVAAHSSGSGRRRIELFYLIGYYLYIMQ